MSSKLCPHCMRMTEEETCPHCGKNVHYEGPPLNLPVGYVVSGTHPYVLGAALGQGGFGITYIALDMITNERVAIKEYFPTYCAGRTGGHSVTSYQNQEDVYRKGMERFLDEARTLKSLSELEHIVNVLDFFEANNTAYLVMEYLDGQNLKDIAAKDGKFPAQKFLIELKPLMEDIHRMHEQGVIHRDIAPDNIIRMPDGQMRLIDFGTARSYLGEKSMTVVVKKGFAPVEQYLSKGATSSSDVYALAATIYYCITGTVPLDSAEREYSNASLTAPSVLGADLTPQQDKALRKALTVQQKDRTQNVQKFLDELSIQPPVQKKPVEKKPKKQKPQKDKAEKKKPEQPKPDAKKPEKDQKNNASKPTGKKRVWVVAAAAALVLLILVMTLLPNGKKSDVPEAETLSATTQSQSHNWQDNILMANPLSSLQQIPREKIQSVTFLDTCADAPAEAWDVSEGKNRSVLAWTKENGSNYDVYIAAENGINAQNACEGLFKDCEQLTEIHFGNAFHTENTVNMCDMFTFCRNLTSLDIGGWNTTNVTNMETMFSSCEKLTSLDLNGWDTSNVTTMRGMFADCRELTDLDVSGWNTSNVTDMHAMFIGCEQLDSPDVGNWDVSKVTDFEDFMDDDKLVNNRHWKALFIRIDERVPMEGQKEVGNSGGGNSSGGGDVGGFLG